MGIRGRLIIAIMALAFFVGCSTEDSPQASADTLPETLFLKAKPEGAKSLRDAKGSAKPGDEVVFEARVGGRVDPFVKGRSVKTSA